MISVSKTSRLLLALGFSTTAIFVKLSWGTINAAELVLIILFLFLLVNKGLVISKAFFIALLIYLIVSMITAYVNNFSYKNVIISYLVLNLYAITFNSVFSLHKNKIQEILKVYLNIAFVAGAIGVFQEISWILDFPSGYDLKWFFNGYADLTFSSIFLRVPSIFTEPGYLAPFLVPAAYISLKSLVFRTHEINRIKAIIILLGLIFTFSLIGYFGLLLAIFILFRKNLAIAFATMMLFIVYGMLNVQSIKPRITALVNAYQSGIRMDYNFSSLISILNFHITKEALKENPVLGAGIDGYEMMSARILKRGLSERVLNQFATNNKHEYLMVKDGGNLFFRTLVEFGLTGVFLIVFLFWSRLSKIEYEKNIQFICLIFLLTYGVRTGQYLRFELWFFIALFFNIRERKSFIKNPDNQGSGSLFTA